MTTATTNQNTQQQQANPDISGTAVANSYQEKNITPTSQVKPSTQTYGNGTGYTVNNGQYTYDQRYGTYNKDIDYTAKKQMAEKGGNNKAAAYYEAMANQKVQALFPNNPKYSTQDKYGSYLNQNSDRYLQYLSGASDTAYDISSDMKGWIGDYNPTYQYSAEIKKAADAGDYKKAAVLEALMNQKIQKEGLPYIQQDNYSTYLNGLTQSDVNMAKYGADVSPTGRYYKVGDDGKAPKGLKPGDYVVTANGTWMVTAIDQNGNYTNAVPVNGNLNTSNYKGQYLTPDPILESAGVQSAAEPLTPEQQAQMGITNNNQPLTPEQQAMYGLTDNYKGLSQEERETLGLALKSGQALDGNQLQALGITLNGKPLSAEQLQNLGMAAKSGQALSPQQLQEMGITTKDGQALSPQQLQLLGLAANGQPLTAERLQQLGILSTGQPAADTSRFGLNAPDLANYQLSGSNVAPPDLTSNANVPDLRNIRAADEVSYNDLQNILGQTVQNRQNQIMNQIDYATATGITGLQRAYEDALPAYQNQRTQVDLDAAKNAKNSALYAEQRGDRGGIGQAQYNALQVARANQLNQINSAQNKAAQDTARQIADLRAKGEFEKADKLMELTNSYLSQLMDARQWAANYSMQLSNQDLQLRNSEQDYLNNVAELTGKWNGQNTFGANSTMAQLGIQYAPYTGYLNGQQTLQLQQANMDQRNQLASMYGVDPVTGAATLQGRNAQEQWRQNYIDTYGVDPYTGQASTAEQQRLIGNAQNYANLYGYDALTGQATADTLNRIQNNRNAYAQLYGYDAVTGRATADTIQNAIGNRNTYANMYGYDPVTGRITSNENQNIIANQNNYANLYGYNPLNGQATQEAQQDAIGNRLNYANMSGYDPVTGQATANMQNNIWNNQSNYANMFGYDPTTGQSTMANQQRILGNAQAYENTYGYNPFTGQNTFNTTQTGIQNRNAFADRYGIDPITGQKTANQQQTEVENDRAYAQTYGNSLLNPTLRTLAAQEFDYDKATNDQKMALSMIDQLMSNNSIPPVELMEQAGIKDKNAQTQLQWNAYLGAVANRYGMINQLGIDPTMVSGYPSTPPGSITSGGGVGTTSTGSSGSGGSSGGSSSRSSSSSSSSSSSTPAKTGESKGVYALSQSQQNLVNRIVSANAKNTTMARTILMNHENELPANTVKILSDQINMTAAYKK